MNNKEKFYITTTLPYVNAEPHAGFAMEIIEADVLARFNRQLGKDVFFNTGTDEHGLKLFRKAQELGMDVQDYVDQQAENFKSLKEILNISYDNFIRTTDKHHIVAAQEFWKRCEANGDIYKKSYKTKYCVGCESEKTDSDLVDGKCCDHPNMEIEIIEEENYFFRFSKYQKPLLDLYEKNPEFVLPKHRLKEIKNFVEGGLEDFSISRLKNKMPWGIAVPGDEDQVIYVWFDALINYISTLGWPNDMEKFNSFWPGVQIAGKDNLRFQSAMWQSMLMSAGIEPSKQIFINGFITVDGQKMSKSTGNVISPAEMVEKFGVDGTRYLLLSGGNFGEDMDITWERMTEKFNADLANGLGNLVSRVVKLYEKTDKDFSMFSDYNEVVTKDDQYSFFSKEEAFQIQYMRISNVLDVCMSNVKILNRKIEDSKPWELEKSNKDLFEKVMSELVKSLSALSIVLFPLLPETSQKIKTALETKVAEPLFQRIK
ncbi:MAG: Methionine-tRNA ligase [Candidatus Moranbacteria bacterium GW2011_GWD2_36_12]|nr:MAG: Methionine-tRNA ligase [Candidatus Moranbacteria bacterium GW2011_GWD2_36_12]KKQ05416.1 MAG: Methionine-tRNA ligase [Candidatus Moranbacteria bacterium GW2011_GWE2_36_40]